MNKEKQYVTIAAMVTILVGLIIAIFLLTSQKNSGSSNDTAKQQTSQVKKDPKLDQMTLPQLNTTIADDESEVRLVTTAGDITLKLFNRYAPLAVENFISHAKAGYYNNTVGKAEQGRSCDVPSGHRSCDTEINRRNKGKNGKYY